MQLLELVTGSQRIAAVRSRLDKTAQLAALLRAMAGDEVHIGVALLSGEVRQGRLGIGWAALRDADAAAAPAASLSLIEVDRALTGLAAAAGPGAKAGRQQALGRLFARATAAEQDFLRRLLLGELRQGAQAALLLEAAAKASGVPIAELRRAAMLGGDSGTVAAAVLRGGAAALAPFRLQVLQPLLPMLAQPAGSAADAVQQLGEAAFEWKLDGARVQVHRAGDEVRVFTRGLNDVTASVPELVEAALSLPSRQLVLDGELIALRPDGRPQPFQVTMRRFGRRLDVERLRAELPLQPFFFDVLHQDGQDLLDQPGAERWRALAALVPAPLRVPREIIGEAAAAEAFLQAALARGHEGAMAKALDAPYEAGRRGARWLKIKVAHTLDLVVLAAEWGSGRRRGWLSNLHLGARDPDDGFVMLGKTFKGMTDELLAWQTAALQAIAVRSEGHVVWVRPELVVAVTFDGVQRSRQYPGGVALRFARLQRYRPDKTALEADTIAQVRAFLGEGD